MPDKSNLPIKGIYLEKLPPDINFTDEPVVENTFVDDCKEMIKIINNRYK